MTTPASGVSDVIVVGAGMAGLTAARGLVARGFDVMVVDKGRAVGGRMATRRFAEGRFDHGAQHFSARSAAFREEVAAWIAAGSARVWFESASATHPALGVEPRHVGSAGMRGIPEHLAAGLDVRTGTLVRRIEIAGNHVRVVADDVRLEARGVVVTAPLPQSLALLAASGIGVAGATGEALESVVYDPALAVMARLDGAAGLGDGHAAPGSGPVAWIADNGHKGVSAVPAVTIHSSAEFAREHFEDDPSRWTQELLAAAAPLLAAAVTASRGHRWRYSQPRETLDIGAVATDAAVPVVLAGEALAGARVEGAYLSGAAAAAMVADRLG